MSTKGKIDIWWVVTIATAILLIITFIRCCQGYDLQYIVTVLLTFLIALYVYRSNDRILRSKIEEDEKKSKELIKEAEEREALYASLRSGTYDFSALDFYKKCEAEGITSLDNEFSEKKAQLIAENIFKDMGAPDGSYQSYMDKIPTYFAEGKKARNVELRQIETDNKKPKVGSLTDDEAKIRDFNNKYSCIHGMDKRKRILSDEINQIDTDIAKIQEAQEALMQLGTIMASSMSTQKKSSGAFEVSLANSVGGTGAAVLAAMDVAERNAKVERYNAESRAQAAKWIQTTVDGSMEANRSECSLKKSKELLKSELEKAKGKLALDSIDQEELLEGLNCTCKLSNIKRNAESTSFEIKCNNTYVPNVPDGVKMSIDGSLIAKIYCDKNTLIDEVKVALPLYGIECGKEETLKGVSEMHMDGEHTNYMVKIFANDLWLAEL